MFFNMGGQGRGGPADTKLYDLLNVKPDASDDEIKKSYKKLAKEYHPDKNPEQGDKFKEISYAYDILSDPRKRQIYDAQGLEGLEGGGGGGGFGGADLFSHIFGGGGGGEDHPFGMFGMGSSSRRRQRKYKETVHPLRISLEDAYKGKTSKLQCTKRLFCDACKATGSASGKSYTCGKCKGRGAVMMMKQIGPGMIQQMQAACPDCKGEGSKDVPKEDVCKKCNGQKTKTEQKILEVVVQRGMDDGEKVVFRNEGDQMDPEIEAGDVIIVIQVKEHPVFERKGDDLYMKKKVSLNEALCGYEFIIDHLDGRRLLLKNKPGDILTPKAFRGIVGEGMPTLRNPEIKGNLIVEFSVNFPEPHFLDDDKKYKMLANQLPPVKQPSPPKGEFEEVSLMEYDENRYKQGSAEAYDDESDDEHTGPHPGVQCQQS